jgi:RNA exonuclease 1
VIAIDCEMCETTDPVTGQKETNSLVRVSALNALDQQQVLVDELVSPIFPISDARTRIHGITEEQLSTVKYTLRHIQAILLNIIDQQTIIIGHALHHDLKALHLHHS